MPPIIAAVATILQTVFEAVGVGSALEISYGTYVAVATVLVTSGASMLISGVVGLIRGALSGSNPVSSDMVVSSRDANAPWRVVYGFTRMSGVITFCATSGQNNGWLYLVLTICKGPIQSIDTLYFDGAAIPVVAASGTGGDGVGDGGGFDGTGDTWGNVGNGIQVHVEYDLGDPSNTSQPFPGLANDMPGYWTDKCLQQGQAKAYVRLLWNANLFATGVPNITFDVHGKQVYDPRSGQTAWSDNTALCVLDYLTDQTIGLQADLATEINTASFVAAANVCDEQIALAGGVATAVPGGNDGDKGTAYKPGDVVGVNGGNGDCALWVANTNDAGAVNTLNVSDPGSGYATASEISTFGGSGHGLNVDITTENVNESQYTCNGAFTVDQTPGQILNDMSLAMAGYVAFVQGQFVAIPGAWSTPTITLGDDDLRAPLEIQTQYSRRDIFNSVHGTYLCEANDWQPSDYPAIIDGTYVDQDGIPLWKEIDLPFTTSASMAQRIASIQLQRARRQITLTAHCKLTAGIVSPGDVIMLNHPRFNWTAATFFVTDVSFVTDSDANGAPSLGVDLILQQSDANIYAWDAADELPSINYSSAPLPDPTIVMPPTNVTATSGESVAAIGADGLITNQILLEWTAPTDQFVVSGGQIVITWRLTNAGEGSPGPWLPGFTVPGAQTQAYISPVSGNTNYDIAIWAVNSAGVSSAVAEVLGVSTSVLISSFTGEAATVSSLANFTQDDLVSGVSYSQYVQQVSNENMIANPSGLVPAGAANGYHPVPGWSSNAIINTTFGALPTGEGGPCIELAAPGAFYSLVSNTFTFTPGATYLYSGWYVTSGTSGVDWYLYGGPNNIQLAVLGGPTAWTAFSASYTVPLSSPPSLSGFMQFVYFNGPAAWILVWGCSVVMVRNLGTQVAEANGNYFAGQHGADVTADHTAADTAAVNGVASSSISPIASLMPSEAGADITSTHQSATTASLGNLNSDDLASGVVTVIPGATQIADGLSSTGNLKFKNIGQTASTNGSTTSTTPVELSGVGESITTKGNDVLVLLTGSFWIETGSGTGTIAVYRDSTSILIGEVGNTLPVPCTLSVIDAPSESTHSYEFYWQAPSGATLRGDYITLQVVELG